ncbi:MAG: aminoglycoside phosphotransferase [Polaromonas sp.]|nr:aminoglycoside phosphotransferase [Polaromonas sp.]
MTDTAPDYGQAGEAKLRAFVQEVIGGEITSMERQVRWRPAWFVDVLRDGELLHLHLRGDREGDVAIFPELRREADVISVLGEQGIKVPRIYGFCEDPPCILMDAVPGSRNMAEAASDEERSAIAREYMAEVAAMHRLPVEPFVAKGVHLPQGAEEIALVGLDAYMPLYQRTKSRPEPMLEFVIGWLRRNAPQHRTRASFIQFDSGQFHFKDGKITGLYDFEFSMIGDAMTDIATMRMRNSIEPLGDAFPVLCRHYEEFSGEKVDHAAVEFHTLQFATLGSMQFTGTVGVPQPGDAHSVYLEFDLALRQVMLLSMSALTGVTIAPEPPARERTGDNASLLAKLADTVARIETPSKLEESRKESAAKLIEWMVRADAMGAEMRARDLADVSALLGRPFAEWPEAEAALEVYVHNAGPEQDQRLLQLFGAIEGRRLQLYGPTQIGHSAMHVQLLPTQ